MRWAKDWRTGKDGKQHIAAARMTANVLKAALGFGQLCGYADCKNLRDVLSALRLPSPKPRNEAPTAADVARAMMAALALDQPSAALCYALQFETAARQYDIAGQWIPINDPRIRRFTFQGLWREVRQLAGLPESLWNRDLRAGALTEASIRSVI